MSVSLSAASAPARLIPLPDEEDSVTDGFHLARLGRALERLETARAESGALAARREGERAPARRSTDRALERVRERAAVALREVEEGRDRLTWDGWDATPEECDRVARAVLAVDRLVAETPWRSSWWYTVPLAFECARRDLPADLVEVAWTFYRDGLDAQDAVLAAGLV